MRSSVGDRPNTLAAFLASGLTSFICPSSAPTTSTGDMPPISSVTCFQVQPFSRLMSRIFSVSSSRLIGTPPWLAAWVKTKRLAGLRAVERSSGSRRGTPSLTSLRRGDAGTRCDDGRRLRWGLGERGRRCMGVEAGGWSNDRWFAARLHPWFGCQRQLARAWDEELDQVVAQGIVVG